MHVTTFSSHFENELADRLRNGNPRHRRSSHRFRNDSVIFALIGEFVDTALDDIGDAECLRFCRDNRRVAPFNYALDLAAGKVCDKKAVGKTLVMTKIKSVYVQRFTMLERIHRSRIDVEVGIKFLETTRKPRNSSRVPSEAAARPA
jgi:hypothetical protein